MKAGNLNYALAACRLFKIEFDLGKSKAKSISAYLFNKQDEVRYFVGFLHSEAKVGDLPFLPELAPNDTFFVSTSTVLNFNFGFGEDYLIMNVENYPSDPKQHTTVLKITTDKLDVTINELKINYIKIGNFEQLKDLSPLGPNSQYQPAGWGVLNGVIREVRIVDGPTFIGREANSSYDVQTLCETLSLFNQNPLCFSCPSTHSLKKITDSTTQVFTETCEDNNIPAPAGGKGAGAGRPIEQLGYNSDSSGLRY